MTAEPEISVFRPDRPGIRKVLGDLEAEIMELVWKRPINQGTTVRDVFEVLYERRRMAYTTIMNTMTRLAKKHFLRVEKQYAAYIYYPVLKEQEFIDSFVARILENLFVEFSGATRAGIEALPDQEAIASAHARLDEIMRRRASEEEA
ncbi:MAG TPA: BlaI/MecI/CopY family transcriptional regulator [Ktedonobacteraceae bacterium]|nr:BlaI/MecI/CopY family transcriptional regulator [Ktedonobacteraceae bacterium]